MPIDWIALAVVPATQALLKSAVTGGYAGLAGSIRSALSGGRLAGPLRSALGAACEGFQQYLRDNCGLDDVSETNLEAFAEEPAFVDALAELPFIPHRRIDTAGVRDAFLRAGLRDMDEVDFQGAWRKLGQRFQAAVATDDALDRFVRETHGEMSDALSDDREERKISTLERMEELLRQIEENTRGSDGPAPDGAPDLKRYLRHVELICGHIVLTGLLTEKAAASVPVNAVYVPLRASWPLAPNRGLRSYGDGDWGHPGTPFQAIGQNSLVTRAPLEALCSVLRAIEQKPPDTGPSPEQRLVIKGALAEVGAPLAAAGDSEVQNAAWARLVMGVERKEGRDRLDRSQVEQLLRTAEIDEVFRFSKHLLIEGDPGSGKTTQLKHVAMALADAHGGHPERAIAMGFEAPYPLPVFVELRELARWIAKRPVAGGGHAGMLVEYIEETVGPVSGGAGWIRPALEGGGAVLLLDGLDEVPDDRLRELGSKAVHDFLGVHAEGPCRFALTTRPAGLTGNIRNALSDLAHCVVQPLEAGQIDKFVRAWYGALVKSPGEAAKKADDLLNAIVINRRSAVRGLAELASTPITLTAIAVVHQTVGRLPELRAELYELCVSALCDRWDHTRGVEDPPDCPELALAQKRAVFQELAHESHARGEGAPPLEPADIIQTVRRELTDEALAGKLTDEACNRLIDHMGERSGLIVPARPRGYRFRHLTFEEFLTARRVCDRADEPGRELGRHLNDPWWREVIALAPAYKALGSSADTRRLMRELIEEANRRQDPVEKTDAMALIADILVDLQEYKVDRLSEVYDETKGDLAGLLEEPRKQSSLPGRVAIGRALGRLGDPRKEVTSVDEMPLVPGGPFAMGSVDGHEDEKPEHEVDLPAYRIGRYLVTNAQYEAFAEAGGYGEGRYWPEAGERGFWRNGMFKGRWDDTPRNRPVPYGEPFGLPNHPVVGVTWYEALAFCRWLTEMWHEGGALPDGWQVSLPSEAEWEKGARGGMDLPQQPVIECAADGIGKANAVSSGMTRNPLPRRRYPWGEELDGDKANTKESEVGATSAVGCFAGGAGPYGLRDLAGNAWEWTRSEKRGYPYNLGDGRENPTVVSKSDNVVLRGGAFYLESWDARCAYRGWNLPYFRLRNFGFRVIASPFRP